MSVEEIKVEVHCSIFHRQDKDIKSSKDDDGGKSIIFILQVLEMLMNVVKDLNGGRTKCIRVLISQDKRYMDLMIMINFNCPSNLI